MNTEKAAFAWFYIGTGLLALVVGVLIGVSSSPVVGVVVPLLFALLTAGGGLYVILGKDGEATSSPHSRVKRASFMGKQLVTFALGLAPGLWGGVWVKVHGDTVWQPDMEPRKAAVTGLTFTDPRALAGFIELDRRLIFLSVPLAERQRMLTGLHAAMAKRSGDDALLAASDATAIDTILTATVAAKQEKSAAIDFVAIKQPTLEEMLNEKPIG
jgi:hypothetical protein